MPKQISSTYILTIAATAGALSTLGQAMVLRETATLFCGFEPAVGAVLAGWLFWVAVGGALGARLARGRADERLVAALAVLLGAALPATLLILRASRRLWDIPAGELPSITSMLGVAWTGAAPFCLLSGALFSLCWAAARPAVEPSRQSSAVYVAEALGAAVGGLAGFLTLLWGARLLDAALCAAWLAAIFSLLRRRERSRRLDALVLLCLLALLAATLKAEDLEHQSRSWLWPPASGQLLAVRETAHQSLVLTRSRLGQDGKGEQYSLFSNGVWAFSLPDPLSAEQAIHPALLQHPAPRSVLCLGGDFYGLANQAFKHPSLRRFDYVDPDPDGRALLEAQLPAALRRLPPDVSLLVGHDGADATDQAAPRVARIIHRDAASFVREADARGYDVLILLVGEPLNAQRNRFYTVEFFQRARGALAPGGVLALALPAGLEAVGPAQAQQLKRAYATLAEVFPGLAVLPGDEARLFASVEPDGVSSQASLLIKRMLSRGLNPDFTRPELLADLLNPFKAEYFQSFLQSPPKPELNRDFFPACFADSLASWSLQAGWRSGPGFWRQAQARPWLLWTAAGLAACLLAWGGPRSRRTQRAALRRAIALAGGAGMTLEVGLLLGYQLLQGELHSRLALFVAAYMAGLGFGAAASTTGGALRKRLLRAHGGLCLALAAAPAFVWGARLCTGADWLLDLGFAGFSLAGGWLGGRYFSLAAALEGENRSASQRGAEPAGMLYAYDTFGAALAALLVPLLVIPLYGLPAGFAACGALCLAGLASLRRDLPKRPA